MRLRTRFWSRLLLTALVLIMSSSTVWAEQDRPTVALVLGGGSARGFSHVGLIKALEENGIPIDIVVGTSMGSIVAGLYAGGFSADNIEKVATHFDTSKLFDIPFPPTGGVVDSRGIYEFLDELLGGRTFAELPIPFRAVAVNLATGQDVALGEGRASKGIQASMSIPGVFPAVEIDGQYYVDGGLRNNVPANVAADMGADVIIAVWLAKEYQNADYRRLTDNLRLSLSAMMGGYAEIHTALADVLIVPKLGTDSSWEFQRVGYFIQEGYKAGMEHMDQIKAAILAKDPDFEFQPYQQPGYSSTELQELVRRAEERADSVPKRFTFRPELQFDPFYSFLKLGFKFTHGPLSSFGIGYRYGFDPLNGGHEVFVDWGEQEWGSVDFFLRKSPERESPTFGISATGPQIGGLQLEADYVSQGEKSWQISASSDELWTNSKLAAGLSLKIGGIRPLEDAPNQDKLLVGIAPQIKIYPWGEEFIPVTVALFRPYFIGRLTVESPLPSLALRPSLRLGIGSEVNFFGLYPTDVSLGIELKGPNDAEVRFGITGPRF
ncbi:MAG: patatin-like phospholipase family protein [Limnochordia bacterium]|jgi:NTE family protein|nr:patatin-like phospholipase family protein [Bacillota bacterium]NLL07746.1 patatin-like phospholipase family protein [Bacillota bacterium]HBG09449.1 hypothetical protein [Bacillota bacterium]